MVPAWDGTLDQVHDHNHDHDHEDKQMIIWISARRELKRKSANSNKHKLIRNWHFLNVLYWRFCKSWKRVKQLNNRKSADAHK